jgi:hypothetical protein
VLTVILECLSDFMFPKRLHSYSESHVLRKRRTVHSHPIYGVVIRGNAFTRTTCVYKQKGIERTGDQTKYQQCGTPFLPFRARHICKCAGSASSRTRKAAAIR